jgi:RimJ/RimL family protein N-acetyltransferase
MGSGPAITFRPLAEDDLPLMHRWLNNPDVARWYPMDEAGTENPSLSAVIEHYRPRVRKEEGADPTYCYLTLSDGAPIGYIQCYRVGDYAEYAAAVDYDDDAWGIDLFIGEDEYRGRGLGAAILRAFVRDEVLTRPQVQIVMINPNPENRRAVRCYEKAGFHHVKTVWVPEDNAHEYVMVQTRAEFESVS